MLAEWSLFIWWRGLTTGDPAAWAITLVVGGAMVWLVLRYWPADTVASKQPPGEEAP
jgi:hypothetical protein